jgi:hypothetical protein
MMMMLMMIRLCGARRLSRIAAQIVRHARRPVRHNSENATVLVLVVIVVDERAVVCVRLRQVTARPHIQVVCDFQITVLHLISDHVALSE